MEQSTLFSMFDKVKETTGLQSFDDYDQAHLQSIYRVYVSKRKYLAELKTVQETYHSALGQEQKLFSQYFFALDKEPDTGVKALCEINQGFIKHCISHLEKRHGCKIPDIENPDRRIKEKDRYGDDEYNFAGEEIQLEAVADRIRLMLGGIDFESKRIQEIKEAFRSKFGCRNDTITQKSNTLSFAMWGCFYEAGYCNKDIYRIRYNYHEEVSALASGIRLFGGDSQKASWMSMIPEESGKAEVFAPIAIWNVKGVSSIRFFKNGRIDLKFTDANVAADFARFYGLTIADKEKAS